VSVTVVLLIGAGSLWGLRQPSVEARLMEQFRQAAVKHLGNVNTPGYSYKLLDPHYYTRVEDYNLSFRVLPDAERFAIRAAVSFFTVPLPWKAEAWSALLLMPQQVAWYGLAALAWVGMAAGWRRDAVYTWVLVGNVLLGAAAVALYNGNVGTLVRMRDTVVPIIVWLSALGGCAVLEWAARSFSEGPLDGHA
jgi:hypothetical protein